MDASPFARVPGEIRNRIYRFAFDRREPIDFFVCHRGREHLAPPESNPNYDALRELNDVASALSTIRIPAYIDGLRRTCRDIRRETQNMSSRADYFSFHTHALEQLYDRVNKLPADIADGEIDEYSVAWSVVLLRWWAIQSNLLAHHMERPVVNIELGEWKGSSEFNDSFNVDVQQVLATGIRSAATLLPAAADWYFVIRISYGDTDAPPQREFRVPARNPPSALLLASNWRDRQETQLQTRVNNGTLTIQQKEWHLENMEMTYHRLRRFLRSAIPN